MWVAHVKKVASKRKLPYGEALKQCGKGGSLSHLWQSERRLNGRGVASRIFGRIADAVKIGKDKVVGGVEKLVFPANKLSKSNQVMLRKHGGMQIKKMWIQRVPINSMIDMFLNLITLGGFESAKKKLAYDKMFHLSLICQLSDGVKVIVEKNASINISTSFKEGGEKLAIPAGNALNAGYSLDILMNNARKKMGDHRFFQYNGFENNCQDFILGLLRHSDLLTSEGEKFIKQDAVEIMKGLPRYTSKILQLITDLRGKADNITGGRRRRVKPR